jgi:peptide/nickel transport system substrate-binding protein
MDQRARLLVSGMSALVVLVGCSRPSTVEPAASSSSQSATTAQPKRIVAGIVGVPKYLVIRPEISAQPGTDSLEEMMAAGLSRPTGSGDYRAELAESPLSTESGTWKVFSDGRMETTWRLRPDAKWQDGTPITADDILFTAKLGADKDLAGTFHPAFNSIESITATDARTVVAQWSQFYMFADSIFSHKVAIPVPRRVLEASYNENKHAFESLPYWTREYMGAGPYRLKEWAGGSHASMTANEHYILGRPKIDEIEVRFIGDANTLMANILSGTIELTASSRGVAVEETSVIRDQWPQGRLEVALYNWFLAQPQFLNPTPAIVGNVQFRKALMHGVDRQEMNNALAAGLSSVAHSFVGPDESVYKDIEPSLVKYDYDPRKMIQIIEGFGYTRGADGMFRDAQGQALALEIRTTSSPPSPQGMAIIADYWQRSGVAMTQSITPRQLQDDGPYRANFPAIQFKRTSNTLDVLRRRLHSSEAPLESNSWNGGNDPRYMNPEVDALLDRYMSTVGRVERTQILSQIMRRVTDEVVFFGMIYTPNPVLIHNRLVNVGTGSAGVSPAWNAFEWDVRAP